MATQTSYPASTYSIAAIAQAQGVHPDTIRRMISRGDLAAYRVGRQIRIRREDAERAFRPIPSARLAV